MTPARDQHKPLPKIRTFAQDLEDERKEQANSGSVTKEKKAPVELPKISMEPTPPLSPKKEVAAVPKVEKPVTTEKSVPKVEPPKKEGATSVPKTPKPTAEITPPKTIADIAASSVPTVIGNKASTPEVRDHHYEATVITDSKHKRLSLGREILKSVNGWLKEKQKNSAARKTPKYTVPQAELRKGVIQQATSQTGRGAAADHSAVLARLRENSMSGKTPLASQIQIKRDPVLDEKVEATKTFPNPTQEATTVPGATNDTSVKQILEPVTPIIPVVTPYQVPTPVPPTQVREEYVNEAPDIEPETTFTNEPLYRQEFLTPAGRRGVDVYVPYAPVNNQDSFDEEFSEPEQVEPLPYTPPIPTRVVSTIAPILPQSVGNYASPMTEDDQRVREKFGTRARDFVTDEKQDLLLWTRSRFQTVVEILKKLHPRSLLQNPNHLVLTSLVICTLGFIIFVSTKTIETKSAASTIDQKDSVAVTNIPKDTVTLLATNKSALFGSINAKINDGEGALEIVFVDAAKNPISTTAFATIFYNSLDPNFIAAIKSAQFGVYRGSPWIMLTVDNELVAKGGMLAWETTMSRDLDPLFGPAIGNPSRPQASAFTDSTDNSVDTRVLANASGESRIIYGFINRNTILITQNSLTFSNLAGK